VLGQGNQQQEEHRERRAGQRILHRVELHPPGQLDERQRGEGEQHEQERVLHGAKRQAVGIHRLDQRHAEQARAGKELPGRRGLQPEGVAAGRQLVDLPVGREPARADRAPVGRIRADEGRMAPARLDADLVAAAERRDVQARGSEQLERHIEAEALRQLSVRAERRMHAGLDALVERPRDDG
jgi:hypothetical protein